jgi:hypothetical protein
MTPCFLPGVHENLLANPSALVGNNLIHDHHAFRARPSECLAEAFSPPAHAPVNEIL